jgi:hypothetical protein
MGFKQRERRRTKKFARERSQKEARGSGSSAGWWWLTPVSRDTCCARPACRTVLRRGGEMVYRHEPLEALCVRCADRERIFYRPSLAMEAEFRRRRKGRRAPA